MAGSIRVILLLSLAVSIVSCRTIYRLKRQVEREDSPPSEVVVIKDTQGNFPSGPSYGLFPADPNNTDVIDLDVNEEDGTFSLGGRLPHFHDFHHSFAEMFDMIQRRFDEMTRRMAASFGTGLGTGFNRPDVDSLPDNYNNTQTELITVNGRQFIKKTTTIKKGGPGTAIFISSTTYEPVNDSENVDRPEIDGSSSSGDSNPPKVSSPAPEVLSVDSSEVQPVSPSSSPSSTGRPGIEREELSTPSSQ